MSAGARAADEKEERGGTGPRFRHRLRLRLRPKSNSCKTSHSNYHGEDVADDSRADNHVDNDRKAAPATLN